MNGIIQKRADYISWDEYFMGVAKLASLRSKDPNSQVGACIVGQDNKILSMGTRRRYSRYKIRLRYTQRAQRHFELPRRLP